MFPCFVSSIAVIHARGVSHIATHCSKCVAGILFSYTYHYVLIRYVTCRYGPLRFVLKIDSTRYVPIRSDTCRYVSVRIGKGLYHCAAIDSSLPLHQSRYQAQCDSCLCNNGHGHGRENKAVASRITLSHRLEDAAFWAIPLESQSALPWVCTRILMQAAHRGGNKGSSW